MNTRMNARKFLFISLLLCFGFAQADTLKCADPGSTLLWKIEGNNSTVHLFGSMHLGEPAFYPLPEKIEQSFRDADHVVFELDPRSLLEPANQARLLQAGQLPSNQRLDDVVSPELLNQLQTILANIGLPLEQLMGFRPWFITTVLSSLQYAALGYSPDYGVEQYLARELSDRHSVLSLETLDQQLEALQTLDGEAFLAHALAEFQNDQAMAQQLVTAWRCADKPALTALINQGFNTDGQALAAQMAELKDKLFTQRNSLMARQIDAFLKDGQGDYFVVVGSGHYLGENSIIEILEANGHRVVAIRR